MKKQELKANLIISGPIFPEPVQVMMTHDMGNLVKVIGKGLRTEKFQIPPDLEAVWKQSLYTRIG